MTVGFAGWSLSLLAGAAVMRAADGRAGIPSAVMLVVAGVGLAIAAGFATETVAGQLPPGSEPTPSGRAHDLGSGVASLALGAAALLAASAPGAVSRQRLIGAVVVGLSVVCTGALLAIGDPAPGLRQRLLVLLAVLWQIALLSTLRRPRPEIASPSR